ncbi:MAG: PIN domain-containing protein [Deltaproteobacteria bacterium]|jgi:PIN domain nuclease of toxin-antitoxin system|nr:PIN domain-containing protein [Deltaproteobacteria bacterium]
MEYLADTVTVIRHFSETGKIGKRAFEIINGIERGEHHCYVSTISLVEILYLSEKKRIDISLEKTLEKIKGSENYSVISLTAQIDKIAESIDFPEIFDRLIISTAKYLKIPVLTSDKKISSANFIETVWK